MPAITLFSLATAIVAVWLFGWLADSVTEQETTRFDTAVREWVHCFANPLLTRTMIVVSFLGKEFLAIAGPAALIVFLYRGWKRAALWLTVTMLGALAIDITLKLSFHRARPVPYFVDMPHTYSFPSGHSLMSFCFYFVMAGLLAARLRSMGMRIMVWFFAAALVVSIGLSRIYLGVHYPSDVIAGYLAAAVWVSTMLALDRWRKERNRPRAESASA